MRMSPPPPAIDAVEEVDLYVSQTSNSALLLAIPNNYPIKQGHHNLRNVLSAPPSALTAIPLPHSPSACSLTIATQRLMF